LLIFIISFSSVHLKSILYLQKTRGLICLYNHFLQGWLNFSQKEDMFFSFFLLFLLLLLYLFGALL
ncbi:hypothetical protein E5Q22_22780, partial [Escherichia coli]|nr:hypothetical protein [Escherichia coli]